MSVFGTDIKNSFTFTSGDLDLVSNTSNMGQAIVNRLNTDLGFYDWCYTRYGGDLFSIPGMKNNNKSLEYLKIEIESILRQDPRIRNVTADCSKENKNVYVDLQLLTVDNTIESLNLVIQDDLIVKIETDVGDNRL